MMKKTVIGLFFALALALVLGLCAGPARAQDERVPPPKAPGVAPDYRTSALGLRVRDLTGSERKQLGIESGVMVEHAIGAAASAGIQAADVVTQLNGRPVAGERDFWRAAEEAGWKFTLTIRRGADSIAASLGDV